MAAKQSTLGGLQAGRSSDLDAEEAQQQRATRFSAYLQCEEERYLAKQQPDAALRWENEALQRAVSHATPLTEYVFGVAPLSANVPLGWLAWKNSRSGPHDTGALGSSAGLLGIGVPQQSATLTPLAIAVAGGAWGSEAEGEVQFVSRVVAGSQLLDQVRKEKAAAVKCENYRLANQLKSLEKELLEALAAVLAHADGLAAPAKLQEGKWPLRV